MREKIKVELEVLWNCPRCKTYNYPTVKKCNCCGQEVEIEELDDVDIQQLMYELKEEDNVK